MDEKRIVGSWIHAHERDHDGVQVFCSADEPLPPSRGRRRLKFNADGSFIEVQPGADDRSVEASGTYRLEGRKLTLYRASDASKVTYDAAINKAGKSMELKKP